MKWCTGIRDGGMGGGSLLEDLISERCDFSHGEKEHLRNRLPKTRILAIMDQVLAPW